MNTPIKFQYRVTYRKSYELKAYNSPHRNVKEAELDIQMAIEQMELKEQMLEGLNQVTFDVIYTPQADGYHIPVFYNPVIEQVKEEVKEVQSEDCLNFWMRIKRLFKKQIKVLRCLK